MSSLISSRGVTWLMDSECILPKHFNYWFSALNGYNFTNKCPYGCLIALASCFNSILHRPGYICRAIVTTDWLFTGLLTVKCVVLISATKQILIDRKHGERSVVGTLRKKPKLFKHFVFWTGQFQKNFYLATYPYLIDLGRGRGTINILSLAQLLSIFW